MKFSIGNNATETAQEGIALILEPTPKFYDSEFDGEEKKTFNFTLLFKYVLRYKPFLTQLIIGLTAGSLLQRIFPFLTQSIVDVGIQNQNIHFIYLVLCAQLLLFSGELVWIL